MIIGSVTAVVCAYFGFRTAQYSYKGKQLEHNVKAKVKKKRKPARKKIKKDENKVRERLKESVLKE
jgi:hypothetical protein